MSSFRQYGGINRAATNNIIRNRYSNSDNPTISNYLGQPNSKIVSESHLDLSGNSILNVNGIYFTNGDTFINGYLGGNLTITGNLEVQQGTILDGSLNVSGATQFYSTLEVADQATFNSQVTANADVQLNSTLEVADQATFNSQVTANADVQLNSKLEVADQATFNSQVNGLYINNGIFNQDNVILDTNIMNSMTFTGANNTAIGQEIIPNITSGGTNSCFGFQAGYGITTGNSNTLIGSGAGLQIIDACFNTAVGYNSFTSGNYSYSTAIGTGAQPTTNHQIVLGTNAETVYCPNNLQVTGQTSSSNFVSTSDYRIKTEIKPINTEDYDIDDLNPVAYINTVSGKRDTGFIAHELQTVFPHLVSGTKDDVELQTINYQGLIAILTKEIQELRDRVDYLEKINKIY
jgi:hypothetical protein